MVAECKIKDSRIMESEIWQRRAEELYVLHNQSIEMNFADGLTRSLEEVIK